MERVLKENYPKDVTKKNLTAEEMSEFYKGFLDRKLSSHANYNLQWQIRNIKLVLLSLAVSMEKIFHMKR